MGGIICCIGQFILNICKSLGLDKEMSGSWCSILLILLSVILTGLNLYPSLANWGGAGALVPITGFANGVAAPAIEFQKEGQVFESVVKYLRSRDRSFCMVFFELGIGTDLLGGKNVWILLTIS